MGGSNWRKLHNKEPHDTYSSPYIIQVIRSRRTRWVGHLEEKGNEHRVLVGKPQRKRPVLRPMHRLEDNFNMDVEEI
jgi:hypothetical protein